MTKDYCEKCGVKLTEANRSKAYRNRCKRCVANYEREKRQERLFPKEKRAEITHNIAKCMKTKICTDIKQSQKLIKIGLDPKTADMFWRDWRRKTELITIPCVGWGNEKEDLPAWSLSALLKLMPQFTLNGFCNGKFNCRDERADNYALVDSNPLDAAYSMVVLLIEQGYIKTEKKCID